MTKKNKRFSISIESKIYEELRKLAFKRRLNLTSLVREILTTITEK